MYTCLPGVRRNVRSLPWFIVYCGPNKSWSTIRLSINESHYLLIIHYCLGKLQCHNRRPPTGEFPVLSSMHVKFDMPPMNFIF